jgi:hypothetical protein
MRWRVVYAIDVNAESSLEAVLQAYAALLRSDAPPIFDVYLDDCFVAQIDLADPAGTGPGPEVDCGPAWNLMSLASPRTSAA